MGLGIKMRVILIVAVKHAQAATRINIAQHTFIAKPATAALIFVKVIMHRQLIAIHTHEQIISLQYRHALTA